MEDGWGWSHRRPDGSVKPMEEYEAFLRSNQNIIVSNDPKDLF